MSYKIPSNWTKHDFCSAAFNALLSNESKAQDIAFDLHDCLLFGFSSSSSYGFRFDYSSYANGVIEYEK